MTTDRVLGKVEKFLLTCEGLDRESWLEFQAGRIVSALPMLYSGWVARDSFPKC